MERENKTLREENKELKEKTMAQGEEEVNRDESSQAKEEVEVLGAVADAAVNTSRNGKTV